MSAEDVNLGKPVLNPTALRVADAARVLGLDGAIITRHIQQGAPTAVDGTINLVHYAAWLNQRLSKANS